MLKGRVSYRIAEAGVEFKAIAFPFPGSIDISVTVSAPAVSNPDDASLQLDVGIAGEFSRERALSEANAVVTAVADRLAYQWGRYLPTPTLTNMAFDEGGVQSLGSSLSLFCRAVTVNVLGTESVGKLRAELARSDFPGEPYLATFRAALGCSDPIGQFLCLYGILMTIACDDQRVIDTIIERYEPGQIRTPRPDKPNVQETSYTRLRNEVAHRMKTRSISEIRAEMEQRCPNLIAIVRSAIA
jgi:hypothetical protein